MDFKQSIEFFINSLFQKEDDTFELRVLGVNGNSHLWEGKAFQTIYGYYNNPKLLIKTILDIESYKINYSGCYVTVNPVNSSIIARSNNRLKAFFKDRDSTTKDIDIMEIRWLLIDVDPIRPAHISSTKEELQESLKIRDDICAFLTVEGFCDPIKAMSGNGAHALFPIEPMPIENASINAEILTVLSEKFNTKSCKVDTVVANPSRIWKVYGTLARKGDNTPERPHRRALIQINN